MLTVNKLLQLSKEAKANNNLDLEKQYLEAATVIDPNNIKVLNALVRCAKKRKDNIDEKKWLEKILELKPTGEVIAELVRFARIMGDLEYEKRLLLLRQQIEPNNKKAQKRVNKINEEEKRLSVESTTQTRVSKKTYFLSIDLELFRTIQTVREIIYSDADFDYKKNVIKEMLFDCSEEIKLAIFSEFYKRESYITIAQKLIKKYKAEQMMLEETSKVKLANYLFEMVTSRRTMRGNWEEFWINSRDDEQVVKKLGRN